MKSTTSMYSHNLVAFASLAVLIQADMTIFCKDNSQDGKEIFGGVADYKACTDCECYIFELMCLESRPDEESEFWLYSRSL